MKASSPNGEVDPPKGHGMSHSSGPSLVIPSYRIRILGRAKSTMRLGR